MKRLYFSVFLVSCGTLIFEISLIRLFSISLSHHFAFMVISIAMLGIGSAGTMLSLSPALKPRKPDELTSKISIYAACAGTAIILSYAASNHLPFDPVKLSWDKRQLLYIAGYYLTLSVPFFFTGLLIATFFSTHSEKSGTIYSSDLLGAAAGSLTVLILLNITAPENSVLTASTLCLTASFIAGNRKIRIFLTALIAINLLLFILHPAFINIKISPYKPFSLFLKYPGSKHLETHYNSFSRIDTFKSPAARFAPGLSLTYYEPLPEQIGISIDGSEMNAITKTKDREALRFLGFLPAAVAYELKHTDTNIHVLVADPKGGLQVLLAELYGAKNIHKIESNPLLTKIIRDDFREFSGGIFNSNTWTGFARSWLYRAQVTGHRSYDIIDLSLMGTTVSGAFSIAEEYRFTVEAFNEYFNALKRDGIISISIYLIPPPRIELRILATVITSLNGSGITNVEDHIAAIRSWDSMTILVKKSPFNREDIELLKKFTERKRFDIVYYHGIKEQETNVYIKLESNEPFHAFNNLTNPEKGDLFIKNYLFDISPSYDNKPFFNYFLKVSNIKAIYQIMGQKWLYFIEEGYLMPVIFIQVFLLSFILILLPVILKEKNTGFSKGRQKRVLTLFALVYFSAVGAGFMFVEMVMIQKGMLILENPSYAVAVVLTAILVSSGLGSLVSAKYPVLKTSLALAAVSVIIFIYNVCFPAVLSYILQFSMEIKIVMFSIFLFPLGFFMGMPFPSGIRLLGHKEENLIPWAWAVNGCMSVLAPILTTMFAIAKGFDAALWAAAVIYLTALVFLVRLNRLETIKE